MRISHYDRIEPVEPVRAGFRSGHIVFRDLMTGDEGSPNNYGLQMVDVPDSYRAPRHRHNFEQVRVMLDGSFGFGPGQVQERGSVGYFCEGTPYTQAGEGRSTTLLLQIGGPTGQGFMSRRQLREGIEALRARGSFDAGVYTWFDDAGTKHNQDSYEAVWEHVHGREVVYPKPQYDAPILFRPERFRWRPLGAGVAERSFGRFNDRGLGLSALRVDAGARHAVDASAQARLLFALEGSGRVGPEPYRRWSTIEIGRGEQRDVVAEAASEFFVFALPDFKEDGATAG